MSNLLTASTRRVMSTALFVLSLQACGGEPQSVDRTVSDTSGATPATKSSTAVSDSASLDSAFAALQQRGADSKGMGVDQRTSTHKFDTTTDGGRIELTRSSMDTAGVAQIRRHLQAIAKAFAAGNFSTPAFVHAGAVPGTDVMAAKRDAISYRYGELPGGGEVRIVTTDSTALHAVHAFMAFQRGEHHSAGHAGH
jgi:hypothetical protein